MVKVFLVESSAVIRSIEKNIIQMTKNLQVVGESSSVKDIVNLPHKFADFIFVEASSKNVNEVERILMQKRKNIPNIILLSYKKLTLLRQYSNLDIWIIPDLVSTSTEKIAEYAVQLDKDILELKTTKLLNRKSISEKKSTPKTHSKKHLTGIYPKPDNKYRIVLVGVSTGGPGAILKLLDSMGKDFPLPILITQHIDSSFERNLTEWLDKSLALPIHVATDGEVPKPGHVYFAPADYHMTVDTTAKDEIIIRLNQDPPVNFLRPSVDVLFSSGANSLKSNVISVLLTGMGADGAQGSCDLREKGAYTIAESEETCVIYGMPKAAYDMGGIVELIPLYAIAERIRKLIG